MDTLNKYSNDNGYTQLYVSSPSDVWCVGNWNSYSDRFLHYDGIKWSFIKDAGAFDPWSTCGFSANDIWFGGGDCTIWHFTNGKINKVGSYPIEGYSDAVYKSFWGNSSNDIYLAGCIYTHSHNNILAIIMHYDGTKWEYVVKPEMEAQFLEIKRGIKDSPNYFLISYKVGTTSGDSAGIMEYDGKILKRLYFDENSPLNGPGILSMNDRIYFGFREKIYKYINNQFVLFKDFCGCNVKNMVKLSGRNEKDMFVDLIGGIGHYNGTDLKPIYNYETSIQIFKSIHL